MDIVIKVKNVTKKFRLYYDKPQTLKERFLRGGKGPYKDFYALKNVSFEIKKGSTVGLIGKNGSGKSTLLKIINRTMFPNTGQIEVKGRVSSLIELGAGFHPDLSGRENIYTNATIFGLKREEIEKRIPDIIKFSELEDFIDNPVRTYSSGMYARLAFSVAIHVDADILLVDEILSVGDVNFQAKCNSYMRELQKTGVTIVIVSHDLSVLDRLCDYAIFFEHGQIIAQGEPREIQMRYLEFMAEEHEKSVNNNKNDEIRYPNLNNKVIEDDISKIPSEYAPNIKHWGNQAVILRNVKMYNERHIDKRTFYTGEKVFIEYNYYCNKSVDTIDPIFGFGIFREDDTHIYGTNTLIDALKPIILKEQGIVVWELDNLSLLPGDYSLQIAVVGRDNTPYDYINDVTKFRVISDIKDIGTTRIKHKIIIDGKECE